MRDDVIRVLSIEDNPGDARLIQEWLAQAQRMGWDLPRFEVEPVPRLQAALTRLKEDVFDVVLSDLDLPDSRAGETIATLRQHIPHMPLVVLTGREDEALAHKSVRAGVQDYLYKAEATGSLLARTMMYAIERQQIHDELERRVEARTAALRESEQALRRERDKAERYLNIAPSIILALDTQGCITLLNEMGADILECDQETVVGENWFDTFLPERVRAEVKGLFGQLMAGEVQTGQYVDNVVRTRRGDERMIRWRNTLLRNDAGEITGVLSSGEDITARKQVEDSLRESEIRYHRLLNTLQEGIWVIDAEARTTFVNPKMAEMLGYTVADMQGKSLFTFMDESDAQIAKQNLARRQDGVAEQHEFRFLHRDGSHIYTLLEAAPIVDGAGRYEGAVAGVIDITARERAQEALREREERLRLVVENISDVIFQLDLEGRITYCTPSAERLLGFAPEEVVGTHLRRYFPADGLAEALRNFERAAAAERVETVQAEIVSHTGALIPIETTLAPLIKDGQVIGVQGAVREVTGRRRVEESLQRSEARLQAILNNTPQSFVLIDPDYAIQAFNQTAAHYAQVVFEKTLAPGQSILDYVLPSDKASFPDHFEQALLGQTVTVEKKMPNGKWFSFTYNPIHAESGAITGICFNAVDVTERKQAEEALRESREQYRVLFESFPLGITVADSAGRILEVNAESERLLGIPQDEHERREIDGEEWQIIRPDGSPMPAEEYASVRALREGRPVENVEMGIIRPDAEITWINVTAAPLLDDRVAIAYNDVTARKRAEAALRESEVLLSRAEKMARMGAWAWDVEKDVFTVSEGWQQIHGCHAERLSMDDLLPIAHPEDRARIERSLAQALEEGQSYAVEHRIVRQDDGAVRIVQAYGEVVCDAGGEPIKVYGVGQDITARKRTEESLRESKLLLDATGRMARVGGWELDTQTLEVHWTEETYRIHEVPLDYKPPLQEAIDFFHPADRERLVQAIQKALDDGEPYDMELRFITAQGRHRWTRTICQPQVENGEIVKLLGTFQDITERKRAEDALHQTAERLHILHEIETAILRAQSSQEIAVAALKRLHPLIPCRQASITEIALDRRRGRDMLVLVDGEVRSEASGWYPLSDVEEQLIEHIRRGASYRVDDVAALEARSSLERALEALGVRSFVAVPLLLNDTPIGTLNLSSEEPHFFEPGHVEILQEIAASLAVALRQARLLEQTRQDAETKALLLREVNHRVKNNLDAIIGLLYLERRHAPPEALPAYRPIMEDLTQRITGLAQVHQMLSEAEWAPLNLSALAERVIRSAVRGANGDVDLALDVAPSAVRVRPAWAQHLALILSELTTNTLKHAAVDRDAVRVAVQITPGDGTITLTYRDDGPGYPADVLRLERHSAGLDIVKRSVRKNLRGELTLRNAGGAVAEIRFASEESEREICRMPSEC